MRKRKHKQPIGTDAPPAKPSILPFVLWLCSAGLFIAAVLPYLWGYAPLYPSILILLGISFIALSFYMAMRTIQRRMPPKPLKTILRIATISISSLLLVFSLVVGYFLLLFDNDPYQYIASPDNSQKIVVFKSSFLKAAYTAYPLRGPLLIGRQHSNVVFQPDIGADPDVEVVWESENVAKVYLVFDHEAGRKESDMITVKFN